MPNPSTESVNVSISESDVAPAPGAPAMPAQAAPAPASPAPAAQAPATPASPQPLAIPSGPGADVEDPLFAAAEREVAESGDISKATFAALSKKFPPRLITQFVNGTKAMGELRTARALQAAGGQDQYQAAVAWAQQNLNAAEVAAFNEAVGGRSQEHADMAVYGLMGRFRTSTGGGTPQGRLVGQPQSGGSFGSVVPFRDMTEQASAMQDRRYVDDVEYRNNVLARVAASTHY